MAKNVKSTIVLEVNGKQVENSFNGLNSTVRSLERELKKLTPGTQQFMNKAAEVKEARKHFERVKNEIDQVNGRLEKSPSLISKFTRGLLDFGSVAKNIATLNLFEFLGSKASQTANELLKISDAMADVQKTTGMALNEVKELWDAFDNMDTRTSKLDRLKIAEVGGRLGVAKEEMKSFVQEIDKVYVALGDSYEGGLEHIVNDIGKMKNLFKETSEQDYAKAINGIGSSLNELAANGVSSEKNIADFTLRVGALPDALKPSIDKVMGLGAAFEESGVDSQIAASGYSNFMKVAGENLDKFAYSMHMSYEEAQKLFNESPEEFFLKFSEGMRNMPADETAILFDSLKIGTLEVQKAVGAAANNTDKFREAIELSNKSLVEGTSITNEFNVKNQNAAAIWQKIKNTLSDAFSSTNMINFFETGIRLLGSFLGVTNSASVEVNAFREKINFLISTIKVMILTMLSYHTSVGIYIALQGNATKATLLGIVAEKTKIAVQTIAKTVTTAYALAKATLTGNTIASTRALIAFNTVVKANPLGLFVAAITAVVGAISLFSDELKKATTAEKELIKAEQEAIKTAAKETSELDKLYKAATDSSKGKDAQREAVEKLQRLYPSYFGNMDAELIMLGKAEKKYLDLKDAILASAKARAAENILTEITQKSMEEQIEIQKQIDNSKKTSEDLRKNPKKKTSRNDSDNFGEGAGLTFLFNKKEVSNEQLAKENDYTTKTLENKKKNLENKLNKEIGSIQKYIDENIKKAGDYEKDKANKEAEVSNNHLQNQMLDDSKDDKKAKKPKTNRPPKDETKNQIKDSISALSSSQSALNSTLKEMLDAGRKFFDEQTAIMQEGQEKEETIEKEHHRRRLEDLKAVNENILQENQKHQEEIQNLETAKSKTKSPEAIANYDKAIEQRKLAIFENLKIQEQNNMLIEQMQKTHSANMQKIYDKYQNENFKKFIEAKQWELEQQALKNEREIQSITSLDEAKEKLKNAQYLNLTDTELANIRTLEEAKRALRENADRAVLQAQLNAMMEQKNKLIAMLKDPKLSKEAIEALKKNLEELEPAITRIQGAIQGNGEKDKAAEDQENRKRKESVDILGFSAQQWEDMYKNLDTTEGKVKGIIMVTESLSNAFRTFAKLQMAMGEREMKKFTANQDKKKQALLRQLNMGLINQEQYHKSIQQIEDETAEKKRKIQQRAAKAEKAANIMSAIAGTASAVVGALTMKPWSPANIVLASVVGALGAAQTAIIAAQPIPEFDKGGFTGNGYGKPDRSGFKPAGIVHEQEYVTPKWMLQNPVVADVVDWMESIRTGRTALPQSYAEGGATTPTPPTQSQSPIVATATTDPQLIYTLSSLNDLLSDLKDNGIDAYMVEDAENGKRIKRTIKMFEKIENKNARKTI